MEIQKATELKQEILICPHCKREMTGTKCPYDRYYLVKHSAYQNAKNDDNLGQEIGGKYGMIDRLGVGGMGAVYKAIDQKKNFVAIKILRDVYAKHTAIRERFVREAEAGATLSHPNVVPLIDFGREKDGRLWLAMEFVQGWTLRDEINHHGAFKVSEAIQLCKQILSGLAAAHDAGMIHRDLKHDNIMYYGRRDQFVARIVDFGVVKSEVADLSTQQNLDEMMAKIKVDEVKEDQTTQEASIEALGNKVLTADGMLVGSPSYMSPEQIRGLKVGPPADLYALAVVVYEVLTAKRLFSVNDYETLLKAGAKREAPMLVFSATGELIPEAFALLIDKALAQDPADRYPDAHTMLLALNQIEKKVNTLAIELLCSLPKKSTYHQIHRDDTLQQDLQVENGANGALKHPEKSIHEKLVKEHQEAIAETLEFDHSISVVVKEMQENLKHGDQKNQQDQSQNTVSSASSSDLLFQGQSELPPFPKSSLDWLIWLLPPLSAMITWFILKK